MPQTGLRFSIRAILIATAYMAIALAALVNPNKIWLGVTFGITLWLVFTSLLGAIYRADRARAFWTGFAVFGFGYLAIVYGPFTQLATKLPSTLLLDVAHQKYHTLGYVYQPSYYPPLYSSPVTTYIPGPASAPTTSGFSALPTSTTPEPATLVPVDEPTDATAEDETTEETTVEAESTAESDTTAIGSPSRYTLAPMPPYNYVPPPVYNGTPVAPTSLYDPFTFTDIGQAVCTVLFAALGGMIAQCMFVARQATKAQ